jgi:hypothetical protein
LTRSTASRAYSHAWIIRRLLQEEGQVSNFDKIGHAAMLAWRRVKTNQSRMWGDWMQIGDGLLEGRRWAMARAETNKPEGKGYVLAYGEWLKRFRLDDLDKADRAKLLQLMEERPAVEEWRLTLTDYERRTLNNPTTVWRKWTAATKVKKPRPRTADVPAGEHTRAKDLLQQAQARVEELQEELAATFDLEGDEIAALVDWHRKALTECLAKDDHGMAVRHRERLDLLQALPHCPEACRQ